MQSMYLRFKRQQTTVFLSCRGDEDLEIVKLRLSEATNCPITDIQLRSIHSETPTTSCWTKRSRCTNRICITMTWCSLCSNSRTKRMPGKRSAWATQIKMTLFQHTKAVRHRRRVRGSVTG